MCIRDSPYEGVTNNQAEYIALICGMRRAQKEGMKRIVCRGDSEVVIYQMTGDYQCYSDKLVPLNDYACELEQRFLSVTYQHVSRANNCEADELANRGKTEAADVEVQLQLHHYPPVGRAA